METPTRMVTEENRQAQKHEVEPLWDVRRVADYLGVSTSWIYHRAAAGQMPRLNIGNRLRFDPAEIREWALAQHGTPRGPRSLREAAG